MIKFPAGNPIHKHAYVHFCWKQTGPNWPVFKIYTVGTPGKINMEPENTPLEREKHLIQTIIFRFKLSIFRGVCIILIGH